MEKHSKRHLKRVNLGVDQNEISLSSRCLKLVEISLASSGQFTDIAADPNMKLKLPARILYFHINILYICLFSGLGRLPEK